jgi:hypothetical protein
MNLNSPNSNNVLITGDATEETSIEISQQYPNINYYLLPHHGSSSHGSYKLFNKIKYFANRNIFVDLRGIIISSHYQYSNYRHPRLQAILPTLKFLQKGEKRIIYYYDVCISAHIQQYQCLTEIIRKYNHDENHFIENTFVSEETDYNILETFLDGNITCDHLKCIGDGEIFEKDNVEKDNVEKTIINKLNFVNPSDNDKTTFDTLFKNINYYYKDYSNKIKIPVIEPPEVKEKRMKDEIKKLEHQEIKIEKERAENNPFNFIFN